MGIWSYGVASAYYKSVPFALFLNHLFYFLFRLHFFFINYSTFVNFLKSHSLYKASLDQPKYLPYEKCLLELEFSPVLDFKVNLISSFSHVCVFFPYIKILCSLKSEKCLSRFVIPYSRGSSQLRQRARISYVSCIDSLVNRPCASWSQA